MNAHDYFSKILFIIIIVFASLTVYLSFNVEGETPDSLTVSTGTITTGDINSLYETDNNFLNVSEVIGTPGFVIEMNMINTGLTDGKVWTAGFRGYYFGSIGHNITFEVYDFTAVSWVELGGIDDSIGVEIRYNNFTSVDYVNNDGDVNFRIIHNSPGNTMHVIGLDYFEVWEQDLSLNETFSQQIDMIIKNLWSNSFDYFTNDLGLLVANVVMVNNSGLIQCNDSAFITMGSLEVNSGGLFRQSSGLTEITTENSAGYELDIDGNYIATSGTLWLNCQTSRLVDMSGTYYSIIFDGGAIVEILSTPNNIDHDMIINLNNPGSAFSAATRTFNIDGDLFINSGDFTFTSNGVINCDGNVCVGVNGEIEVGVNPSLVKLNILGDLIVNGSVDNPHTTINWNCANLIINGGTFYSTDAILTTKNIFNNGTIFLNDGEFNILDGASILHNSFFDLSINGSVRLLNNVSIGNAFNIGDISTINCTGNIEIYGNVETSGTGYLVLSGLQSANDLYFYPGNNSYSNIIQYNGSYNISKPTNDYMIWNCDNFTQNGFVLGFEEYSNFDIYNWNSIYFNYTSNSNIENNVFGDSHQWNLKTNKFNLSGSLWDSRLLFDGQVYLQNGTFEGVESVVFTNDLMVNGSLNTLNFENSFTDVDTILTINSIWEMNNRLGEIDVQEIKVFGELRFLNYTMQTDLNGPGINQLQIDINNNSNFILFENSTGEINISASVLNPFILFGRTLGFTDPYTNISVTNLSDYYLNNVIISSINNSNVEYITANGIGLNLGGSNWDFLPPAIMLYDLINNTVFDRNFSNLVNISVMFEELSYFHSYFLQLKSPDGITIYELSVNLSTPLNQTSVYQIVNLTNFIDGTYTYIIMCNDTHNKINSVDVYKIESAKNLKIQIDDIENKIGYWDNHKLKESGKYLYVTDYIENDIIYWIEFKDKGNHEITYNVNDLNFKILHEMKVKNNSITFKICSNYDIYYFEQSYYSGHFIIKDIYAYDLQDFKNMKGTISVSHLMKEKDYNYYEVTLTHSKMVNDKYFIIDPLSMVVNSNFSIFYFNFGGLGLAFGNFTITNSPEYESTISNYTITIDNTTNEIIRYVVISSIDGEFWNSSVSEFDNDNLSYGTHTINVYVVNNIDNFILIGSKTHIVFPIPTAIIIDISVIGNDIILNGGAIRIQNSTIYRYAWRLNTSSEIYNSTGNPITVLDLLSGDYQIFFKVLDENGVWSVEVYQNFTIGNLTILNENDNWWVNANSFIYVVSAIGILGFLVIIFWLFAVKFADNVIVTFGDVVKAFKFWK